MSGDGSKGSLGIARPRLLVVAFLFALGVIGLAGVALAGVSSLGMLVSDATLSGIVGGLVVLVPASLLFAFTVAKARGSLRELERKVESALEEARSPPMEVLETVSSSTRELSRLHEEGHSSHTLQEQAQDRMEASHERQEAKLLDLEDRLKQTLTREEVEVWMRRVDQRLDEIHRREGLLLEHLGATGEAVEHLEGETPHEFLAQDLDPASTYRMDEVPGVSSPQARMLEEHGVATTDTFLYADIEEVQGATGLPADRLRSWKHVAEMMVMIDGIGPGTAERLVHAGLGNISALAAADPEELTVALETPTEPGDPEASPEEIVGQARRYSLASRSPATS